MLFFAFFLTTVLAHSWIDTLSPINNPQSVGYPRGYSGHNADLETTQYKVLTHEKSLPICGPTQRSPSYSTEYPMLQTTAGSELVAEYLENGHVTKDRLPPDSLPHPGNYSWYWAPADKPLNTFADLNDNVLLSGPSNFDDGVCAVDAAGVQRRPGPIPCKSRITIPEGTSDGLYTLYWIWDFTKLTAIDPNYIELYTTCLDVQVGSGKGNVKVSVNNNDMIKPAPQVLAQAKADPINLNIPTPQIKAVLNSTLPKYSNTSFVPRLPTPAVLALPQSLSVVTSFVTASPSSEVDVLTVTSSDVIVTTTFVYSHPESKPTAPAVLAGGDVVNVVNVVIGPNGQVFERPASFFVPPAAPTPAAIAVAVEYSSPDPALVPTPEQEVTVSIVTVFVPTTVTLSATDCAAPTPVAGALRKRISGATGIRKKHKHRPPMDLSLY